MKLSNITSIQQSLVIISSVEEVDKSNFYINFLLEYPGRKIQTNLKANQSGNNPESFIFKFYKSISYKLDNLSNIDDYLNTMKTCK
jgi:hypothetical protein